MPPRNKANDGQTVHLGIRVPLSMKNDLDKLAEIGHHRMTDEVRFAIEKHIKENAKFLK